ncbi:MAG TPA: oligosaccharide flippase family protein [Stellaceae bacterium]|nr:oligosaccharide flippase family protein [Stellaceae bacterium]
MSLGRRLVGDTIVYGLAFGLARALSFALLPILARVFDAGEYGAYDLSIAGSRALLVLSLWGMDTTIGLALQGRDEGGQRRVTGSFLLAGAAWSALVALAAGISAPWLSERLFGDASHRDLVLLGAGLAMAQSMTLATVSIVKWRREPRRYLLLTVGSVAAASALGAASALLRGGDGTAGVLAGLLLGTAAFVPVGLAVCRRYFGGGVSLGDMGKAARLGLPFVAIVASEYLLFPVFVRLLLVGSTGLAGVGVFGAANTICLAIMLVNDSFASAWWPYAISEEGASRVREDTHRVMRLYAFLLMLPVAGVTLAAEPLVRVLLGSGALAAAAALIGPIALAYWIKSVRQNSSVALLASGHIWARAGLNFTAFVASLAFAYVLTPRAGVAGAAWGFAAGEGFGLLIQMAVLRRFWNDRLDLLSLAIMAGAFLALFWLSAMTAFAAGWAQFLLRSAIGLGFLGLLLVSLPRADIRAIAAALREFGRSLRRRLPG